MFIPVSYGMFMQNKAISDILKSAIDPDTIYHLSDSIKHLTIEVRGKTNNIKFFLIFPFR